MCKQEKLIYIENYLKTYFDEMILEDLKKMRGSDLCFTIPYILLVSAGIDFLGGLEKGFYKINKRGEKIGNSSERSRSFIKNWMGRVNTLYGEQWVAKVIYGAVRCGAVHQAIFKKGVEAYSGVDFQDKHLYVRINPTSKERVFIHALQFADDFIKAQKIFREEYIKKDIDDVHRRLAELLKGEMANLPDLIESLKKKGFVFSDEVVPSPSSAPEE
ncbi:MAG: hypothetical protein U9M98_03600 [Patescibacteria group bacterium]|nr:hypothetical protein [Patescibacteria group bacterium]